MIRQIWHLWNRHVLCFVTLLHPKNQSENRSEYPQLWYCMPRRFIEGKLTKRAAMLQWLCKRFTGHEISKTEWGYGGGKFVDRNCRWCDKVIKVPKREEEPPNEELKDLTQELGW